MSTGPAVSQPGMAAAPARAPVAPVRPARAAMSSRRPVAKRHPGPRPTRASRTAPGTSPTPSSWPRWSTTKRRTWACSPDGVSATVKGGVGKFRERPRAALQEERDVAGPVPAHAAPRHPRRRHRQDPGQHAPQAQQHGEDDRALPACRALRLCRLPEPGREPARLRTVRRLGQAAARRVSSRTSSRSGEAGGHPQMLWAVDLIERPEPGPSHQAWRRRPGRRQVDLGRRDRRRDRARRPRGVHHVPAQDVPLRSAHAPRPGPLEPAYAAGARSFDHWPNPQAIPPAASRPLSSARSTNSATLSAPGCSTRPGARSTSSP